MVVVRLLAVVVHLAVGIYLRQLRCAGLARLADGGVRRRGAGREKDGKTDNADGCPQGLRKGRTHRTVEQALTPDNATIDRKSVVYGKSVSVSVDLGGRRIIKKN